MTGRDGMGGGGGAGRIKSFLPFNVIVFPASVGATSVWCRDSWFERVVARIVVEKS